jgi:hypothetical protein
MMSQLDHIENRIRWRAKKNALRSTNTGLWEKAPEALKERAGAQLEKPVLYSMVDESTATIVGADGILLVDSGQTRMIPLIDLGGAYCPDVGIATPTDHVSELRLAVRNRGTIKARMEDGPASYLVWKVLQMLLYMREAWFLPEPVEEPKVEEVAEPTSEGEAAESVDAAASESAPSEDSDDAAVAGEVAPVPAEGEAKAEADDSSGADEPKKENSESGAA